MCWTLENFLGQVAIAVIDGKKDGFRAVSQMAVFSVDFDHPLHHFGSHVLHLGKVGRDDSGGHVEDGSEFAVGADDHGPVVIEGGRADVKDFKHQCVWVKEDRVAVLRSRGSRCRGRGSGGNICRSRCNTRRLGC